MIQLLRCSGCKSEALLDEDYQIVCTNCGLCDSTELIPSLESDCKTMNVDLKSINGSMTTLDRISTGGNVDD